MSILPESSPVRKKLHQEAAYVLVNLNNYFLALVKLYLMTPPPVPQNLVLNLHYITMLT